MKSPFQILSAAAALALLLAACGQKGPLTLPKPPPLVTPLVKIAPTHPASATLAPSNR